jgi:hypothetical protein
MRGSKPRAYGKEARGGQHTRQIGQADVQRLWETYLKPSKFLPAHLHSRRSSPGKAEARTEMEQEAEVSRNKKWFPPSLLRVLSPKLATL